MEVYSINESNIDIVSNFMAEIKPEWWNFEGARNQLSSGIGWYYGSSKDQPKGWILCKKLRHYKTLEIECLGYDDNGIYKIGNELQSLVKVLESFANSKDYALIRFTIGSIGLSCHNRPLDEPWMELKDIHAIEREEYDWFLSMGYVPSGMLPNIYGDNYHGILLVKQL
ncbi:hypothetical protein PV797_10360 [Clostridiaceae bacterium M8S5]|nr:hypothetical protein PV797_10360 [Clostridiaceae bacterium M8S5]